MQEWFLANKLSLNLDKTCFTLFLPNIQHGNDIKIVLKIANHEIERVSSCKYLGIYVDENLSWKEHIEYVYKKLIKFTALFYKARQLLPFSCLQMLYFAFVYPHLVYAVEVYANTYKSYLHKLQVLNNKIIRILLNRNIWTRVAILYNALNTLPITDLHEMRLLIFVHKCLYQTELLPSIFHGYFVTTSNVHAYHTRRERNLFLPLCKRAFGQRMSIYRGSIMWNRLPVSLKNCISNVAFTKKLKSYLLNRVTNE